MKRRLHRRYGHSRSGNNYRVIVADQVLGYFATLAEAAREKDADIEWGIRHQQGGPRPRVQRYEGDGEWVTMNPQPKSRFE